MGRVGQKIVCDSKTLTNFCPKVMVFPKKRKSPLEIRLRFFTFHPKIIVFPEKKGSSLEIRLKFLFITKSQYFLKK